jgi:hypothetical protein
MWHRHYAGYKQGDPGYGAKSLAELENQRNNDQQGGTHGQPGQLYSPSPARKGDSSLSGQKGSDTSGMSTIGGETCVIQDAKYITIPVHTDIWTNAVTACDRLAI